MMVDSSKGESKSPSPERRSPQKIVPLIKRRQRDHKNKKRKLRTFMNPDSNLVRDSANGQVLSIQSNGEDSEMGGVMIKHNEKTLINKLKIQLEFYLGDSNLAKDKFL